MPFAVPAAPQLPTIAMLLPSLTLLTAPVVSNQATLPQEFGSTLAKLLTPATNQSVQPEPDKSAPAAGTAADPTTNATTQTPVTSTQLPTPVPVIPLPLVQPAVLAPGAQPVPVPASPAEPTAPRRSTTAATSAPSRPAPRRADTAALSVQQQPAAISVALPVPVTTPAPPPAPPAALPQHGQGSQAAKEIGPAATQPQATNPVDTKGVATAPPPHPVTDAPPTVPSAPVAVPAADMSTSPPPPAPEATLQAAAPVSGHSALTTTAPQVAAPQAGAPQGASPAAQLAPALVQMAHTADGTQRLTVRLTPPDLGQVQIRIDRPTDAAAHVDITVEKPETLTLLLRDQPQLQRALDQAGVPAEGRSVSFHVASPEQSSRSEPATAPTPGVAAGGLSGDGSHGAARQGGQPTQQQHSDGQDDSNDSDFLPMTPDRWVRAGLDITA